jgi:hypothetical protein
MALYILCSSAIEAIVAILASGIPQYGVRSDGIYDQSGKNPSRHFNNQEQLTPKYISPLCIGTCHTGLDCPAAAADAMFHYLSVGYWAMHS